jgi:hypothetical protein
MTARKPRHPKRMINPPAQRKATTSEELLTMLRSSESAKREATDNLEFWKGIAKDMQKAWLDCKQELDDTLMHAKTNHALVGELRCANEILTLANDKTLAEIKTLRAQMERATTLYHEAVRDYNKLWNDTNEEIDFLRGELEHSDADRRMLQRDILAQQAELARWKPFNVRSKDLG